VKAALADYSARDREQVRPDLDEAVRQTLGRLESAEALLTAARWREFFPAGRGRRLTILKQCLEAVLASGHREDFIKIALGLETAYAISAGDERVTIRRDEIALIAAIRANLSKYTAGSGRHRESVERDIRQLLSRAVMADGILDVFKSAGLEQRDVSVLSDEFLAEIAQTKEKNLAVETLRRLLADEIKSRARSNLVQSTKLSERLDDTLRRYQSGRRQPPSDRGADCVSPGHKCGPRAQRGIGAE
jgi:type I restriction enzyme R subunit